MASRSGTHRILWSGLLAAGLAFTASAADAQSASRQAGLRTLTWPGKVEPSNVLTPAPNEVAQPAASAPVQIQPSVLPDYTAAARTFPQSLTPASAFGSSPVVSGGRPYASAPVPYAETGAVPVAQPSVTPTPVPQTAAPQTPVRSPRTEASAPGDPMAPRPDAPIRQLASGAAQASSQPAPQPRTGPESPDSARYYSVHREAGRNPDPTTIPAPFFLDSAPVDLAEPPPPPTLMRNQRGLAPSVAGDDL